MLQISERVQRVRKHAAVQFDFQAFDSYHVLNLKVVATPPDYLPIECHLSIVHHISIVNAVVESIHLEVDVYDVSRLAHRGRSANVSERRSTSAGTSYSTAFLLFWLLGTHEA